MNRNERSKKLLRIQDIQGKRMAKHEEPFIAPFRREARKKDGMVSFSMVQQPASLIPPCEKTTAVWWLVWGRGLYQGGRTTESKIEILR